jgi:predicted CoA-binding protein
VNAAPDDAELGTILDEMRTIAVVGLSANPERPSHRVASYLKRRGFRIVPVNPNEREVLGEPAVASLRDLPPDVRVDVVDVFRRAEETVAVARDAVAAGARVLWLQEGIVNEEAANVAREGGLRVVMDRCLMQTHARLRREG